MINTLMNDIKRLLQPILSELVDALQPPASDLQIQQAEEEIGVVFPEELRELYRLHNGERVTGPGFFFGLTFLSLDDMLEEWRVWKELESEFAYEGSHDSTPLGWIKEQYINRKWLPISRDGSGNHLGIDLDPDEKGIKGQVLNFGRDEDFKYVIAKNMVQFLQFIKKTIEDENYTIDYADDSVSWSYGPMENAHFFDKLSSIELPVMEPVSPTTSKPSVSNWYDPLDDDWKARIQKQSDSPEDFLKKKQLYLIDEQLQDLQPLRHCLEVRELILTANQITDIEPLSACKKLKRLFLGKNPLRDLSPLQHLCELQELSIAHTKVRDLTPLTMLPKLKSIHLEESEVTDFSPLQKIKSLRSLSLSRVNSDQMRSLSQITQLREVTLSQMEHATMDDFALLGNLHNLQFLHIEDASLSHLEMLIACKKLEEVEFTDVSVGDISALSRHNKLKRIELQKCPEIGNLESLSASSTLEAFTGSFQQFNLLKSQFQQYVNFSSLTGHLSEEEMKIWDEALDEARKNRS